MRKLILFIKQRCMITLPHGKKLVYSLYSLHLPWIKSSHASLITSFSSCSLQLLALFHHKFSCAIICKFSWVLYYKIDLHKLSTDMQENGGQLTIYTTAMFMQFNYHQQNKTKWFEWKHYNMFWMTLGNIFSLFDQHVLNCQL